MFRMQSFPWGVRRPSLTPGYPVQSTGAVKTSGDHDWMRQRALAVSGIPFKGPAYDLLILCSSIRAIAQKAQGTYGEELNYLVLAWEKSWQRQLFLCWTLISPSMQTQVATSQETLVPTHLEAGFGQIRAPP